METESSVVHSESWIPILLIYQNWSEAGVTIYPSNEFMKIFMNMIWRFVSWWRPNPLAYIQCLESPSFLYKQNGTFFSDALKISFHHDWILYYIFCVSNPHFQCQNKSILIYLPLCVPSGKLGAGSHQICIQPIESVFFSFFEYS